MFTLKDGDADYKEVLSQFFVPEGNKLFQDAQQSSGSYSKGCQAPQNCCKYDIHSPGGHCQAGQCFHRTCPP